MDLDLVFLLLSGRVWETTGVDVSFSLGSSQSTGTSSGSRQGTLGEFNSMRGSNRPPSRGVPSSFTVGTETSTTTTTISGTVGVNLQPEKRGYSN